MFNMLKNLFSKKEEVVEVKVEETVAPKKKRAPRKPSTAKKTTKKAAPKKSAPKKQDTWKVKE